MSHVASLVAVVLLCSSIGLSIASLLTTWWDAKYGAVDSEGAVAVDLEFKKSLWNFEVVGTTSIRSQKLLIPGKHNWDNLCNGAKLTGSEQDWCHKIKAMRAMIIISAIFSLFGALGVSYGYFSGNTLVDAVSGIIGTFGNIFGVVAIVLACTVSVEDLYLSTLQKEAVTAQLTWTGAVYDKGPARDSSDTPGFGIAIATCVIQLVGGIFSCVGTIQEVREVANLAAVVTLRGAVEPKTRAERAAQVCEGDNARAAEIYSNIMKRRAAGDLRAFMSPGEIPEPAEKENEEDTEEARPKRIPRKLYDIIHRMPQDSEDEIPKEWLVDAFAEIDGDKSGSIDLEELVDALRLCNLNVSQVAADAVMREIDKNASGDVDLREFIQFFRHIEELNRFQNKSVAQQKFAIFMANFCFLADTVVVGVLLMVFINMEESENPDTYPIIKNLLYACSVFLCILFILVILGPILRLIFGPGAARLQLQYELAKQIKLAKNKLEKELTEEYETSGPRAVAFSPEDAPEPLPAVNSAMFGRSYRSDQINKAPYAPQFNALPLSSIGNEVVQSRNNVGNQMVRASHQTQQTRPSTVTQTQQTRASTVTQNTGALHAPSHLPPIRRGRYDPAQYAVARECAETRLQAGGELMSWSPMQLREAQSKMHLPGAPPALTNTAIPYDLS